jgi:molecular chaperone GrpE
MSEETTNPQTQPEDLADKAVAQASELVEEIENLKKQLEGEKARADENLRHWQRAQADYVNYKRRIEQERTETLRYANAVLVSRLLPILDDFERADKTLPESLHQLSWIEGMFLIRLKLQSMLQQEGLVPIEAQGKDFDPVVHEAVVVEPGVDPAQGKVVEEFQRGYKMHDRVIRPSLVKVGNPEAPKETPKEAQSESQPSSDPEVSN